MIIDVHTHAYSEEVCRDPVSWARARNEVHWLKLVASSEKPTLQTWVSRETMLAAMEEAKVDHAVLLGWYWEHAETCEEQNQCMAEWVSESAGKFSFFLSVNPRAGCSALDQVKRAHEAGAIGIGEMHLGVQGFGMRDPVWVSIVEYACEQGLMINFHVTEPLGRPHGGRVETPFEDFLWLAEAFPELKIVLAHWGGFIPFYELNPYVRKRMKNVYYDTAASSLLYDSRVWRRVLDIVGQEKILFGTDYPLRVYPKKQRAADFSSLIDEARNAELKPEELSAILGGNASALLFQKA